MKENKEKTQEKHKIWNANMFGSSLNAKKTPEVFHVQSGASHFHPSNLWQLLLVSCCYELSVGCKSCVLLFCKARLSCVIVTVQIALAAGNWTAYGANILYLHILLSVCKCLSWRLSMNWTNTLRHTYKCNYFQAPCPALPINRVALKGNIHLAILA